MKHESFHSPKRLLSGSALLVAALVGVLPLLTASPAEAGLRLHFSVGHGHHGHRHHRRHHHYRHHDRYRHRGYYRHHGHPSYGHHSHRPAHHFAVPRVIHRRHHHRYEPYYHGRAYYEPHGHYHQVYRFPVHVGAELVHRPYAYCNSHLFLGFSGHRGGFSIGFQY